MKKIMLPLLLLLLLMLFCVWKHAGDFNRPVAYTITQESQSYRLKGSFKEASQIQRLIKAFAKNGASLKGTERDIDTLLNARGSVGVVEKITGHFVKHYTEGMIRYEAETLTVSGIVESDAANEQMQVLLSHAPVLVVNKTKVVKPMPIEFEIKQKAEGTYILTGDFSSTTEKDRLISALTKAGAKVRVAGGINPVLAERDEVIATVEKVIHHFVQNLQEGKIRYYKGALMVSGLAMEKPLLAGVEQDLKGAKVPLHTDLALNLKAIKAKAEAIRKAKEAAAKKAAEAKRRAEQERLAAEAARKAKAEAARQAAEAAKRAEEERMAQEKAAKAEAARQAAQEAEAARLAEEAAAQKAEEERQAQLAAEASRQAAQEKAALEKAAQEAATAAAAEAAHKAEAERQAKIAEALLNAQQEADARKAAQELRQAAADKMAVAPAMSAEEIAKMKENRQAARDTIAQLLEVEIIEFDTAKSSLTPKGENTVDKLALILQNYPLIKVEIAGHTDSDGNAKFNQKLSQSRVDTVKKELISQGISAHRLKAVGYGESKPLVPNTTAENKQKNRRVEIIVIGE